eukprot:933434-Pelagomonas_calceolata.AAC.9
MQCTLVQDVLLFLSFTFFPFLSVGDSPKPDSPLCDLHNSCVPKIAILRALRLPCPIRRKDKELVCVSKETQHIKLALNIALASPATFLSELWLPFAEALMGHCYVLGPKTSAPVVCHFQSGSHAGLFVAASCLFTLR